MHDFCRNFGRVSPIFYKLYLGAEAIIGPVVDPAYFYSLGAKTKTQNPLKIPPICTPVITVNSLAGLGRHTGYPSRKLAKSGDYDQPVPPADSSMTPSQLESLWQDAGDRSQPDPQSWQVSGHQVCRAANPGTHGPSVPETREASQVH
ncbi:hypothetical protein Prudu_009350 [Prunus dulcis]|uniref:Uncharacterized protein n=1 Tax=Prunus dulcis TaxID=3755 RepID=A0A4Y1R6J3_PRUDU|nr:hypothetical protein Prudu_009350 [Prunus dulcis]